MTQQSAIGFLFCFIRKKGWLQVIIWMLFFSNCLSGQDAITSSLDKEQVVLILKNGTELRGVIIDSSESFVQLQTALFDIIQIQKTEIKEISHFIIKKDTIRSDGFIENPFYSRNLITETALPLKKGEGYYQNFMLIANTVSYGISDQFSIGGGLEYISLFSGESPYLLVQAKYGISSPGDNLHLSLGANLISEARSVNTQLTASIFSIATYGTKNNNISVGLGYGLSEGVQYQIGGMIQLSRRLMLVSDHIFLTPNFLAAQVGSWTFRYFGPRFSFDIGVGVAYDNGSIPIISFSHKFG